MDNQFDKDKVIESLFDPKISEIMAELENDGKELSYLSSKSGFSEDEIKNMLEYLIEYGFIIEKLENGKKNDFCRFRKAIQSR